MNLKRVLASFVTIFFCSTIMFNSTGVVALAQTMKPFATEITINNVPMDNQYTISLQNGQNVVFKLNITLKGAIIDIYNSAGTVVYKGTTDDKGQISTILPYGKYTYKEIQAPIGYKLNNEVQTLSITKPNQIVQGKIVDKQETGTISVTKTNEASTLKLAGAEFTITKTGDSKFKPVVITTNNEGVATAANLAFGDYVVTETKAPTGYTLSTKVGTLEITTNGTTVTGEIQDVEITGKVIITKIGMDNSPLEGAIIGIYNSSNEEVYHGVTDAKGQIYTTLPYGKYTYKELKAPLGYTLSKKVGNLEINTNDQIVTGSIKDVKITDTVNILKTNEEGNALAGAVIQIENTDGKVVFKGTTPENGLLSVKLPYGSYIYREIVAPKGYNINPLQGRFTIMTNNEIINKKIIDSKISIIAEGSEKNHFSKKINELPDTGLALENNSSNLPEVIGLILLGLFGLLGFGFRKKN